MEGPFLCAQRREEKVAQLKLNEKEGYILDGENIRLYQKQLSGIPLTSD